MPPRGSGTGKDASLIPPARLPGTYPTDDVLREIGRVAVAAAALDVAVAYVHAWMLDSTEFDVLAQWPGSRVRAEIRAKVTTLPEAQWRDRFRAWLETATALTAERDQAVHAFPIVSWEARDGVGRVSAIHPRSGTYQIQDAHALHALAERLADCGFDGYNLVFALASERHTASDENAAGT